MRHPNKHTLNVIAISAFIILINIGVAQSNDGFGTISSPLTTVSSTVWDTNVISVCWENPANNNAEERIWVEEAIADTWEEVSAVRFIDWEACAPSSQGIRIRIADVNPSVSEIGSRLDGIADGMKLNFTFENLATFCQNGNEIPPGFNAPNAIGTGSHREYCIQTIAVHEFGHVLGFPHEHNRSDRPDSCTINKQGLDGDDFITPYDPDSVMNYCAVWANSGRLSILDVLGIQLEYGARPCLTTGSPCALFDDLREEFFDTHAFMKDFINYSNGAINLTYINALKRVNDIEINLIPAVRELEDIDDSRVNLCRSLQTMISSFGAVNTTILKKSGEIKQLEKDFYDVVSTLPMTVSMTPVGNVCSGTVEAGENLSFEQASASIGLPVIKPGFPEGQGAMVPYNTNLNHALQGGAFARPAVAFDVIPGYDAIHRPEFANDGLYGNGSSWISHSENSWLKVDFGQPVLISSIAFGRDRTGSYDDRDPGHFTIAVSQDDGVYANGDATNDHNEYTEIFDSSKHGFNGQITLGQTVKASFPPVVARFVKLIPHNRGAAIDELEIK